MIDESKRKKFWAYYMNPPQGFPGGYWKLYDAYSQCEPSDLAVRIKKIPYSVFLNSRYWIIVRDRVQVKSKCMCAECGKTVYDGQVHHTTYRHHGQEHLYLEDLEYLCPECHAKKHDKETMGS